MYNLIGQALFISMLASFILSGIALLVSRRSLTRSVYLAGFFANVLDFFYLPLRQIFLKFSDTRVLDKWMASLKKIGLISLPLKERRKESFLPLTACVTLTVLPIPHRQESSVSPVESVFLLS